MMKPRIDRRSFLQSVAIMPAGLAMRRWPALEEDRSSWPPGEPTDMPMITLGGEKDLQADLRQ
jgi:hypothetical protein